MRTYSIQQEESESAPEETVTRNTEIPAKKWKTFLAVLALIAAAFLIIKLQQSEVSKPALQAVNTTAKEIVPTRTATTPSKAKEQTRKKEATPTPVHTNPASYLKATINWRKKLIGGTILEGTLHNSTSAVNLKDPVLLVTWLTKTNTVIATNRFPLYEYVEAGQTISYKLKAKAPSKVAEVKISVESATVVK